MVHLELNTQAQQSLAGMHAYMHACLNLNLAAAVPCLLCAGCSYWTIPKRLLATIDLATGMTPSQAFESAFKLCRGEGPEVAALVAALNGKEAMLPALQHVRGPAGVRQQLLDGTVGLAVRAGWCFLNSSMMQRQEKGISIRAAGVCCAAKPCRNIWGKALHSVAEELGCL